MTTQLDRYRYEPTNAEQGMKLAKWIQSTNLAPRNLSPHDIFLVMATGAEYGWSTMRSLGEGTLKPRKSMQPKEGDRVHLRYASGRRKWIGLHEATGTVIAVMKGRRVGTLKAPTNYAVRLDGETVARVIPWGQIYKENDP